MNKEWRKANREAWKQRIEEHKRTSQTVKAWCKANNVHYKSFLRWRLIFERDEINQNKTVKKTLFQEIPDCQSGNDIVLEINSCKIYVPQNFDKQHLLKCVTVLRELC